MQIIPSTVCSSMTRSSRWIFRKSSQPAVNDIFTGLSQLRNLGTKYWVYGVARKLGFGENSVWSSTPRLGEGLSNIYWRDELRTQPEPRTQSARESTAKPEIERGEGSGEGAR